MRYRCIKGTTGHTTDLSVSYTHLDVYKRQTIYGGTYNLLAHTLPVYGVTTTFVDPGNLDNFEKAIQERCV